MYGGHFVGHPFFLGLVGLLLIGVVVYFVSKAATSRSISRSHPTPPAPPVAYQPQPLAAPRPEPLDILRERFARGEITLADFETAKRALGYPSAMSPPAAGTAATPDSPQR